MFDFVEGDEWNLQQNKFFLFIFIVCLLPAYNNINQRDS